MSSQLCSYCVKPSRNLKKCDQCKMVQYCSRDCKKKAWKTHKKVCASGAQNLTAMAENEDYAELNHALNEWLNFWRMLIHNIGVVAMDLGNHPDDRLATHVWVLELERRPEAAMSVHLFKLTKASIMSREEVAQLLRKKETSEEDVQEWVNDNRGDHTLHTAVFVEDHVRFMWVSFRSLVDYKSNPEESRRKAFEGVESLTSAMNGMPGSEGNVAGAGPALLH